MKLHADAHTAYAITAFGDDWVQQGTLLLKQTLVASSEAPATLFNDTENDWAIKVQKFYQIYQQHQTNPISNKNIDVILIGTGKQHHFLYPQQLAPFLLAGVGVDHMGTAAACRTFNILISEGRRCLALLVL